MAISSLDIDEPLWDFTFFAGVGFMLNRNTVELWVLHASSNTHQVQRHIKRNTKQ